jgi:uncharacterized protein YndB with AHSA1/START domain
MVDDESTPMPDERVTRTVELGAGPDAVWEAVSDPDLRATWLDDDDAAGRTVRVDEVDAGHRLVWTWWRSGGDDPDASTVEIAVSPLTGGGTRVVVTETPLVPTAARASASVPGSVGIAARRWDHRLLGLELLFVAAGACAF